MRWSSSKLGMAFGGYRQHGGRGEQGDQGLSTKREMGDVAGGVHADSPVLADPVQARRSRPSHAFATCGNGYLPNRRRERHHVWNAAVGGEQNQRGTSVNDNSTDRCSDAAPRPLPAKGRGDTSIIFDAKEPAVVRNPDCVWACRNCEMSPRNTRRLGATIGSPEPPFAQSAFFLDEIIGLIRSTIDLRYFESIQGALGEVLEQWTLGSLASNFSVPDVREHATVFAQDPHLLIPDYGRVPPGCHHARGGSWQHQLPIGEGGVAKTERDD